MQVAYAALVNLMPYRIDRTDRGAAIQSASKNVTLGQAATCSELQPKGRALNEDSKKQVRRDTQLLTTRSNVIHPPEDERCAAN